MKCKLLNYKMPFEHYSCQVNKSKEKLSIENQIQFIYKYLNDIIKDW